MAVTILDVQAEHFPKARLIGKRYDQSPNWGEWWQNDWFSILEQKERLEQNGDAYIGAVHIVNGKPEYWIGMFFPAGTEVPEGFTAVDMEPLAYAVCYLSAKENSAEFYAQATHEMCLEKLKSLGFKRKENDWCFERYNCPRFTTPDANGNVILDYGIAIEG